MKSIRKWYFLFASLSFLLPFSVYFVTTNPWVTFTDNGELIGVCIKLGIAHPTGYPLFALLGNLWSLLPLPLPLSFKMNLLSAFWTSISSLFFFLASISFLKILEKSVSSKGKNASFSDFFKSFNLIIISFISALTYSFSRTIWGEATSLEVYSLQLLLFSLFFWLSFKLIYLVNDLKILIILSFVLGLSFSNHLTTVLIVPSFLILLLFRPSNKTIVLSPPKIKFALLFFVLIILGLSVYLYLPLRSMQFPEFNWGWVSRSFDKFLYHVTGKQYRVWMFSSSETISINLSKFLSLLPYEFAYVGLIVVLVGLLFILKKQMYLVVFLFLSFFSCLFYALNYQIHDIETYFSLSLIVLFFFFTAGVYYFWVKFGKIAFISILIPVLLIFFNYKENDDSQNNLVITYTKNIIGNLEPNSIIISSQWDYFCSAFWYLQRVENYRRDIVMIDKELLRRTWYPEQLRRWYPQVIERSRKEMQDFLGQLELFESEKPYDPQLIQYYFERLLNSFVEKNINERPVYVTYDILQNELDSRAFAEYEKIPKGFAIKLSKKFDTIETDFSKLNIEPFSKFLESENHLITGIIQSTKTNLSILGNYYKMIGKTELVNKIEHMLSKLGNY